MNIGTMTACEAIESRPTITAAGCAAIGRRPVGTVHVPVVVVPWRDDVKDERRAGAA